MWFYDTMINEPKQISWNLWREDALNLFVKIVYVWMYDACFNKVEIMIILSQSMKLGYVVQIWVHSQS